MWWMGPYHRL